MKLSLELVPEDWNTALAVVAHPDDLEYGASSAIARWTSQGKKIVYLLVTDGEAGIDGMSPEEAGPLRREEELRSAAVVGVDTVEFLGYPDGTVEASLDLRRDLSAAIRRHQPDCLISMNFRETWGRPSWNHVDHRNLGPALLDSTRDAANRWVFTELLEQGLEPWAGVRMALFGGAPEPTHGVDVDDWIEAGVASLKEHHVYLEALPEGTTGKDPEPFLRAVAGSNGPRINVDYAAVFELIPL